jgi:superfamily II DNA/RNA helicase
MPGSMTDPTTSTPAAAPGPAPSFAALGLSAPLQRACAQAGLAHPTPIQAQAIPCVLRGADLLALAPTGTGKTAAFALPLVERLLAGPPRGYRRVRVLVLVPTRELAAQVAEVFERLGGSAARGLRVVAVHGGGSVNPQMLALRGGADVLVATPGRLLDLLGRNAVRLDAVETLVLDEADRLLDLGFAAEREQVLAALPARRQVLLFSATLPEAVQQLAGALLREPVRLQAAPQPRALPAIAQRAVAVDAARRTELLRHLIRQERWPRVLVFVATRYATEHVARKLATRGVRAVPLHGEMSQGQRADMLAGLKDGRWDVLVTTDLASRGIDIPALEVVVNHDLPRSSADHVHRIGRTGRAGASGLAVSFVSPATLAHWQLIDKRNGLGLALEVVPGFEPTEAAPAPAPGTGGIKGRRPSKKDKLRAAGLRPPLPGA